MSEYVWPEIGNNKVIEFLERALRHNKVAQTYIFAGLDNLGKSTIALAFARNLQGAQEGFNTDLHIVQPEPGKRAISIEAVRELIKALNLSSFSNSYKIGIIKDADLLSSGAKSALLKTLEEPNDKVVIILLATDENNLPATIRSRSQILYFYPVPSSVIYDYLIDNYGANRSLAKDLSNLALGRPLLALELLEHPDAYRNYLSRADSWLTLIGSDVNGRLQILDQIFKDKSWGGSVFDTASDILRMAEGLARDLLLLSLGQKERLQHSALSPALDKTLISLEERSGGEVGPMILRHLRLIAQAQEYLNANVNPRLALEQVVINF